MGGSNSRGYTIPLPEALRAEKVTGRYRRCTSWLCYLGLAARVRGCLGSLGGCLITKSDLILDFEDTTQGVSLSIIRLERVGSRGDDVLMEESS